MRFLNWLKDKFIPLRHHIVTESLVGQVKPEKGEDLSLYVVEFGVSEHIMPPMIGITFEGGPPSPGKFDLMLTREDCLELSRILEKAIRPMVGEKQVEQQKGQ